jgi:DNA-binding transcriptional LysR family regulator
MRWSDRIDRRLKLRDLDMLQAAVEAGSMAKAANELGISQPAISYAVAQL